MESRPSVLLAPKLLHLSISTLSVSSDDGPKVEGSCRFWTYRCLVLNYSGRCICFGAHRAGTICGNPITHLCISRTYPLSMEIMRLKPSFAKKLNPEGYSPMHLALHHNQTETKFRLLDIDTDLVSVQGREGLTPLHIAASGGEADILTKFLVSCPKSIKELTIRKESALHIALKNGYIECFMILLKWIEQTRMSTVLNWTDDEGDNVMHLAALRNQIEVVKLLVEKVDMTSKNVEGLTVLDIIIDRGFLEDVELREMLYRARVLKEPKLLLSTLSGLIAFFWMMLSYLKRLVVSDHREKLPYMSNEDRNAILVVSVLIATATYQAVLDPPDKDLRPELALFSPHQLNRSYFSILYLCFRQFNTLAFLASMIEICLHLPSCIGYALHLVLPLVICYTLLMLCWWSPYSSPLIVGIVIFVLLVSKIPMLLQKIKGDLKPKQL